MKITIDMVDYISALSRLCLPEDAKQKMTGELEQIIGYMDILNALDTSNIEPMSHTFPIKNVLREDETADFNGHAELLRNAPAHDETAFLVPKTVD